MAIADGQSDQQAIDTARDLTFQSHYDYSGLNRPLLMKNNWVKVVTTFKLYAENIIYQYLNSFNDWLVHSHVPEAKRKEARSRLLGLITMHSIFAGTLGALPFQGLMMSILNGAVNAFGDDDDEYVDIVQEYRSGLENLFVGGIRRRDWSQARYRGCQGCLQYCGLRSA